MGIKINNKDLLAAYINGKPVLYIEINGERVWPTKVIPIDPDDPVIDDILSCFALGYWIDEYPWTDDTPWTD